MAAVPTNLVKATTMHPLKDTSLYQTGQILQSSCRTQQHVMFMMMLSRKENNDNSLTRSKKTKTASWVVLPKHLRLECLQYLPVCKDELVWYDVPDTANDSYKGSFVTDVYDPTSTVKQPHHLHFSEATFRVLKQVHPTLQIDLGALYVCEDYIRYMLKTIVEQAATLTASHGPHTSLDMFAKRADSLKDAKEEGKEAKGDLESEFNIVGQENNIFYIDIKNDSKDATTWKPRSFVERVLPEQLKAWEMFDLPKKTAIFQEWLHEQRKSTGNAFYYPQQISEFDIQTAVRMILPGELVIHAVSEGKKALKRFQKDGSVAPSHWSVSMQSQNVYHVLPKTSRSSRAGLQFDVDQIGLLMGKQTGQNIGECAAVYLAAVVEYITAEMLELAGNTFSGMNHESHPRSITPRHIYLAVKNDEELHAFYINTQILGGGHDSNICEPSLNNLVVSNFFREPSLNNIAECVECGSECALCRNEDTGKSVSFLESYVGNQSTWSCWVSNEPMVSSGIPVGELNRSLIKELKEPYYMSIKEAVTNNNRVRVSGEGMSFNLAENKTAADDDTDDTGIVESRVHNHHLQRLAARAGVVQIGDEFGLDEIERSYGALELFLKTIVSDAVTLAAHRVSPPSPHNGFPVVTPKHILAGGPAADRYGVCLVGTGRLQLKEQCVHRYQHCGFENEYMKHAESREHVLSSASYDGVRTQNETVFEPKEWRKYHGCRSVEEFRETKRAVKQQKEDDMKKTVVEREEEAKRNAKEQKAEQTHVATTAQKVKMFHEKSLALIRRMQQSTERIIPFSVMASLIARSVPEWAVGVRWSPVAINLIDFMAEHYLVYLYEVSNLNAINRKRTHVTANDIHLANYLRSTGRSI